jgi:4-diphosphocytidyl-2-C-methyl-D-erythritol kinase
MTGVGESVTDVTLPVDIFAVLANPLVPVPPDKTARIFASLSAPPFEGEHRSEPLPEFSSVDDVVAYAEARSNDLQASALALFPVIETMLTELGRLPGSRIARLSGAGPTCFALFDAEQAATRAASELASRHPDWWIRATRLA